MKHIFIISTLAISAFSCKKQRTCTCSNVYTTVTTYNNGNVVSNSNSSTSTITAEKQTKKYFRMSNACYSGKTVSTDTQSNYRQEQTTESTCTIK